MLTLVSCFMGHGRCWTALFSPQFELFFAGSQDTVWFGSVTLYRGARRSTGACVYAWLQSVRWSVCVYRRCIHCIYAQIHPRPFWMKASSWKPNSNKSGLRAFVWIWCWIWVHHSAPFMGLKMPSPSKGISNLNLQIILAIAKPM